MFESIARGNPRFREWLASELTKKHEALTNMIDEAQLRRAQGHAQCLSALIANLDSAVKPRQPAR